MTIMGLVSAFAARPSAAGSPGSAPKRSKVGCAAYRADLEASAKKVDMEMKIKAGDWAKTPAPLRVLPPGATVCGSAEGLGNVFIASPLFGKDLEAYYRPIYERLGCKPFRCEITDKLTSCKCASNGKVGFVATEERSEVFWVLLR
jgi:hypothetical protein